MVGVIPSFCQRYICLTWVCGSASQETYCEGSTKGVHIIITRSSVNHYQSFHRYLLSILHIALFFSQPYLTMYINTCMLL